MDILETRHVYITLSTNKTQGFFLRDFLSSFLILFLDFSQFNFNQLFCVVFLRFGYFISEHHILKINMFHLDNVINLLLFSTSYDRGFLQFYSIYIFIVSSILFNNSVCTIFTFLEN